MANSEKVACCGSSIMAAAVDNNLDKIVDNNLDKSVDNNLDGATRKTIQVNMGVICLSFFLNMLAFSGLTNLQSSMNFADNVGHICLCLIFMGPLLSNLFVSAYVVRLFGTKSTMVWSMLISSAFPVASIFASSELALYTGATLTGLSTGIMWSAHGSYVTSLGRSYASAGGNESRDVIGRFFGTFFTTHRLAVAVGSLVSSLVFRKPTESEHLPGDAVNRICGASYCYEDILSDRWFNRSTSAAADANYYNDSVADATHANSSTTTSLSTIYRPSLLQIYCLCAIYIFCSLVGPLLLHKCLRKLDAKCEESVDKNANESDGGGHGNTNHRDVQLWNNLAHTLRRMFDLKMLLIMPLTFLHGTSIAFIMANYGLAFTSCTLGIDNVGFVMATFGTGSGLSAMSCALLFKQIGRQIIFFTGATCCLATLIGMRLWIPSTDQPEVLYLFAGLWGICTTIWSTQLISLVGCFYKGNAANAAMAAYYIMLNTSIGVWLIVGRHMCIYFQLDALMVLLMIGMIGYTIVEMVVRRDERNERAISTTVNGTNEDTDREMIT